MDHKQRCCPSEYSDGSKLLTDLKDIKARWKEHFNDLLNQAGSAHSDACQQLKRKPTRNEPVRRNHYGGT